jgi:hypothetical protein
VETAAFLCLCRDQRRSLCVVQSRADVRTKTVVAMPMRSALKRGQLDPIGLTIGVSAMLVSKVMDSLVRQSTPV